MTSWLLHLTAAALIGAGTMKTDRADARSLVRAEESRRIEIIAQVCPAAVCLFPKDTQAGGGSGVLIDSEGYGVTNFHVIAACLPQRVAVAGLPGGRKLDVEILGLDPHGDLAMFRVLDEQPLPAAVLGDSDTLAVGDPCLAVGNPFLLAEDFTPTVTFGIISGLHRYQWGTGRALSYTDCIQVDTSINPGNSGGPLFDLSGRLIGINGRVSIEERGRVNVGVGYAIPINQARRFIPALRAGLVTPHATAGFTVVDLVGGAGGVVVDQIRENSAAGRVGLRLRDRITRFAGQPVTSANGFASRLGAYPARWPVELVFERQGESRSIGFRLEALPLPVLGRGPRDGEPKSPDPWADTAKTRLANRRAVERAMRMYAAASGGATALRRLKKIEGGLVRRKAADGPEKSESQRFVEDNAITDIAPDSVEVIERLIRWEIWSDAASALSPRGRVVRGDEVGGRIAVVVERSLRTLGDGRAADETSGARMPMTTTQRMSQGRMKYEVALDDSTGELLAIEFPFEAPRRIVRYEYDDVRSVGGLRLPHRRTVYLDGRLHAHEVWNDLKATEGEP